MKNYISFFLLSLLFLSACTIEKRHYNKGYYIDWKKSRFHQNNVNGNETSSSLNYFTVQCLEDQQPESLDPIGIEEVLLTDQGVNLIMPDHKKTIQQKSEKDQETEFLKKAVKKNSQKINSTPVTPIEKTDPRIVFGWIFFISGLFLVLFVSILIGAFILLVGLFLINAGRKRTREKEKNKIPEYQDVVYLKSGSIIKGMIMEQVPESHLKIKTADGSIFVYKMSEVSKIQKEKTRQ